MYMYQQITIGHQTQHFWNISAKYIHTINTVWLMYFIYAALDGKLEFVGLIKVCNLWRFD